MIMLRQRNGAIALEEENDPLPISSPNSNTIFYHELPEWQKDNDAITSGELASSCLEES